MSKAETFGVQTQNPAEKPNVEISSSKLKRSETVKSFTNGSLSGGDAKS